MATLTSVTAQDVMQRDVIWLEASTPVAEAFGIFEEERISGAPVIGADGRLVGFLSSRDLTRHEHLLEGRIDAERGDSRLVELDDEDIRMPMRDDYSRELLGRELVQDWMNAEVISVKPDCGLREVCKTMVDNGIHRVVVLDGDKISGILSAFDVVRFLAERP